MKVSKISIKNFKRFSDFVIQDVPVEAKLVLLVGPNGSGKSSLFDALICWYRSKVGFGHDRDEPYFRKDKESSFDWNTAVDVSFHEKVTPTKKMFYFRSAYRNDPDFNISSFSKQGVPYENLRVPRTINNDQVVAENYGRMLYATLQGVYSELNNDKKVIELREELIGTIRQSMVNVFGDLNLNSISDPLSQGTFSFEKGLVKSFQYKNLSGGEKAAFDLLLDLVIKVRYYDDTVFLIDEPDLHMHTRLQAKLVKEMVKIIPNQSQLWLSTHSLGVMRAAKELQDEKPGTVCFLDFDGCNFDEECVLKPSKIDRVVWEKFLSVSLDDLSVRVLPKLIVICEGSSKGKRRKDFDAEIYNRIFSQTDALFVSGGGSNDINKEIVPDLLRGVLKGSKVISLVDIDDRSPAELADLQVKQIFSIGRRNLECYMFDDEVLEALLKREKKESLIEEVKKLKAKEIEDSVARGNPPDDIKSAAGGIYVALKKLLQLTSCGNTSDAFMRDTLASLITPSMKIYGEMEAAIILKAKHI